MKLFKNLFKKQPPPERLKSGETIERIICPVCEEPEDNIVSFSWKSDEVSRQRQAGPVHVRCFVCDCLFSVVITHQYIPVTP